MCCSSLVSFLACGYCFQRHLSFPLDWLLAHHKTVVCMCVCFFLFFLSRAASIYNLIISCVLWYRFINNNIDLMRWNVKIWILTDVATAKMANRCFRYLYLHLNSIIWSAWKWNRMNGRDVKGSSRCDWVNDIGMSLNMTWCHRIDCDKTSNRRQHSSV